MTAEFLSQQIRSLLLPLADPAQALKMRAYLRGQFEFLGLSAPVRRNAIKRLPKFSLNSDELLATAEALWSMPEREFRYTAIDLLARQVRQLDGVALDRLLALARRDPWWETVDGLAGVIGDLLRQVRRSDPDIQRSMDKALADDCLWIRRVAMIHQLGWRLETDKARLFDYAKALAAEDDFFIRKAIGWALRDYARWNPQAVQAFIGESAATLSALTLREAARQLPKI